MPTVTEGAWYEHPNRDPADTGYHPFRRVPAGLWRRRTDALLLGIIMLIGAQCNLPRDPKGTLERVRGGTIRVGVAESKPWIERTGDEPTGVEADLVRQFARSLGARPAWKWGALEDHLEALEHYELDLVVGGLTQATPWRKKLGLTRSYFVEHLVVGVPSSIAVPEKLDGVRVAVQQGSALAAILAQQGAIPVRADSLPLPDLPVAAPAWQLEAWGLRRSGAVLHEVRHVMAAPPGENAWITHLELFLTDRRPQIEAYLKQEAQP